MQPLYINAETLTSALGNGLADHTHALADSIGGLTNCNFPGSETLSTWIGRVPELENCSLTERLQKFDCRNNRLAQTALLKDNFVAAVNQVKEKYGAKRIGLFIGTSTSGIHETEIAYMQRQHDEEPLADFRYPYTQNIYSVTDFIRQFLELNGPAHTISTACSSSAKVFATASRYIANNLCDAAIVGGVDSLCLTTLYGFNSLELISKNPCMPFASDRYGISIGEAAGFMLLEPQATQTNSIALLGYGESSDAHHISTPHPEGEGARLAMQAALAKAQVPADAVNYVHLHGTGTQANDYAEDKAMIKVFGEHMPCSSTKGWLGHTLGAAGITGAIFSSLFLRERFLPGTLNSNDIDPGIRSNILLHNKQLAAQYILTNSFGFGGSNCSLLFGKD